MKLRVRVLGRTCSLVLQGPDPGVLELREEIRSSVLSSHGVSPDTPFTLSLSGSELLQDPGQSLKDCGIVSGDLIFVGLPQREAAAQSSSSSTSSSSTSCTSSFTSSADTACNSVQVCGPTPSVPEGRPLLWEPMLCGEAEPGQAPPSLELLFLSAQCCSSTDALMVAAHLMMLETGFTPQDRELKVSQMPPGWRSPSGVYRLDYAHPLCDGVLVSTAAVCLGPKLSINMILKGAHVTTCTHKLCLDVSNHVTDEWSGGSAAAAFRDLRKLSRLFKDQLAYRLIAAARDALLLPPTLGLAALPPELLLLVLRMLDVQSVVRLSEVSRHFRAAANEPSLWRHLYCRDYRITDAACGRSAPTDWRQLYIGRYKAKRDIRRATLRPLPYAPVRTIHPVFPNIPVIPGIIGGEYDQRPVLPRPRYDPIGPLPLMGEPPPPFISRRFIGQRPTDVRRGFI